MVPDGGDGGGGDDDGDLLSYDLCSCFEALILSRSLALMRHSVLYSYSLATRISCFPLVPSYSLAYKPINLLACYHFNLSTY